MFGPAGLSLPRARALDVALHAVAAHVAGGATGASDPETVARASAFWLPAGACGPAPAGAELRVADGAARAASRRSANRGSGGAAQVSATARREDQVRRG